MTVSFVGSGPLEDEIRARLAEGYTLRAAVAFVGNDGLEPLISDMRRANGQLVVGASRFYITDWRALDKLRQLGESNKRLRGQGKLEHRFPSQGVLLREGSEDRGHSRFVELDGRRLRCEY